MTTIRVMIEKLIAILSIRSQNILSVVLEMIAFLIKMQA